MLGRHGILRSHSNHWKFGRVITLHASLPWLGELILGTGVANSWEMVDRNGCRICEVDERGLVQREEQ